MYHPTLKEARALAAAGPYREIPVARELLSDFLTPIEALRILRARDNHCFLLESAADSGGWGRWSFLGFEPDLEITCKDGVVRLRDGERVSTQIRRPGEALRELLAAHRSPRVPGLPPYPVRRAPAAPAGRGPGEVPGHGPDAVPQRHRL